MPVVADAGSDQTFAFSALPIASVALDGSASGGTGPYTFKWHLLFAPPGSTAVLDDDTLEDPNLTLLNVDGVYFLFLVATDSLAVSSETKRKDAPNSAFVRVVVTTQYETLTKTAPGERDYEPDYHAWVDSIDLLRRHLDTQTIVSHDTGATGAELDTLTDGSNAERY